MTYVARRPQTILGRQYGPGEPVDLTGVRPDTVRRLVDQRRIVPGSLNALGARPKARVVHKSGPWYDVLVGGQPINEKGLSHADADALAEAQNAAAA